MRRQPWWYGTAPIPQESPLAGNARCDVVVVGGGVAGLHAALRLVEAGRDVIVLEKSFCGGGASGRSSGFLTPDSELELHTLIRRFGRENAAELWGVAVGGVALIVDTVRRHGIECDLQQEDSLFVGIGAGGADHCAREAEARASLDYPYRLYDADELLTVHPGGYDAGIRYDGTFTLDPFRYCQRLKDALRAQGARIHERSAVRRLDGTSCQLAGGSVTAEQAIVCISGPQRHLVRDASAMCYHAQTFLAVTERLTPSQRRQLFPGDRLQCWDSRLVYSYYRLTPDERLLLGGGLALTTFAPREVRSSFAIRHVIRRFRARFPGLGNLRFTQYWPGLIDITRDLLPIADAHPVNRRVQYVLGCPGLPWAAWCGDLAARRALGTATDDVGRFFAFARSPFVPEGVQRLIGKPASFAIDYFHSKYGRGAE